MKDAQRHKHHDSLSMSVLLVLLSDKHDNALRPHGSVAL